MSTFGDSRRSIAAWLEAEAPDRASARLVEASRERVRTTPQRTPWWTARKGSSRKAFARLALAAAVVVVGAFGVVGLTQLNGPAIGPAPSHPSPRPSPAPASPTPAPSTTPSGVDGEQDRQWPQRNDEELRLAQERADAGDPAYAWQIDPALDLVQGDSGPTLHENLTTPAIVDRFLRGVLGWDQYLLSVREANPEQSDSGIYGLIYIRCAPGETNPLYPVADEDAPGIERCAPTSAGGSHESVRLDITQPEDKGPNGIWVVNDWAMTEPFTQLDPRLTEADVTAQLEAWLAARVAGEGAEGKVETEDDRGDGRCNRGIFERMCRIVEVPLLYATTSGAPYARYEIERVSGPRPPYAEMEFKVRLFADDGGTVVEQPIMWIDEQRFDGRAEPKLLSLVTAMTENGRPVAVPFVFLDGKMSASAARPWVVSHQFFNYGLSLDGMYEAERITFVPDPFLFTTRRFTGPRPVDAIELARRIRSDPSLEATAPVDVTIGGATGLSLDVTLAPEASVYRDEDGRTPVLHSADAHPYPTPRGWGALIDPDTRMRIYVVDLPEGSTDRMMAIAIGAPKSRFDSVVEAAAPVIDSIMFRAP